MSTQDTGELHPIQPESGAGHPVPLGPARPPESLPIRCEDATLFLWEDGTPVLLEGEIPRIMGEVQA